MARASPILRNTLILVAGQLLGTPLTILLNIITGRYLGAEAFGFMYLASTLARFGFLFVEWGHNGVLPAAVARDHARAGELLGSSVIWRLATSAVVCAMLSGGAWLFLGHGMAFQIVLGLTALQWILNTVGLACQDVVKGFERADVYVVTSLIGQVITVAIVVPTLMLGGKLTAMLVAQAVVAAIALVIVWIAARRAGIGSISFSKPALRELFGQGTYFMSFGIAMALKSNVDAVLLTKYTSPEVVGWHAAAMRLAGAFAIPASALIVALYPTLSRFHEHDRGGYVSAVQNALRGALVLAVPMAASCALYRELGIRLFSKENFGPAQQNLLVFAPSLLFVYISMTLGTAILASGRQRQWSGVQMLCVVVSLGLGPLLIPWSQKHYGNGGIGVCIAGVVSDVLMATAAFWMIGRGVIDRTVAVLLLKVLAAGGAMIAVGLALSFITPFVVAPITLLVYFGCLWLVGGIHRSEFAIVTNAMLRRLKRS